MELKTIMAKEVSSVLEEATGIVTNRLVMENLLKNGKVTIEEATFLNKIAAEVITEAAEDFIPDSIEVPDAPVEESTQAAPVEESTQVAAKEESTQAAPVEESTQVAAKEESTPTVELTESEAIVNNLINKLF